MEKQMYHFFWIRCIVLAKHSTNPTRCYDTGNVTVCWTRASVTIHCMLWMRVHCSLSQYLFVGLQPVICWSADFRTNRHLLILFQHQCWRRSPIWSHHSSFSCSIACCANVGVRGGEVGGHVSPAPKKINENTKKIKIARNCENSHLPRSFRKWGWK